MKHLLIAGLLLAMPVAALAEPNLALYELPVVQVTVYDAVKGERKIIEIPES